jgi:DNA mismatch repair protein MLH1
VTQHSHRGLSALFSGHVYVGALEGTHVLLQHLTRLYLVHLGVVSSEFFYQRVLRRWGNLSSIRLSSPAPVETLCLLAMERDAQRDAQDAETQVLTPASELSASAEHAARAAAVASLLAEKAEMLEEYLGLVIRAGNLVAIPQLVDGYVPPLVGLPHFILGFSDKIDWTAEVPCFESLARHLASFYRVDSFVEEAPTDTAGGEPQTTTRTHEQSCSSTWTVQHVLLPAIKREYEPPSSQISDGTIIQLSATELLYKVFERC